MGVEPAGRLWTRDFVLAIVTNLFISMVYYLLMVSMALYAVERFRASDSAAGFASSSFILGAVVSRLFSGKLMEVVGRKRLLIVSLGLYTLLSYLYIPSGSLELLLALRLLHGMAFGAGSTALAAGVQGLIPPARRSEGTGYFGVSTTLSTAVGPFLAVLLSAGGNYDGIFWFCTISSIAALAVGLLVRLPERRPAAVEIPAPEDPAAPGPVPPVHKRRRLGLTSFVDPDALPISLVTLLGGFAYSGIVAFLTSYTREEGLDSAGAVFFLVYAVAVLVSRLFAGRLQDRRGDNMVMYPLLLVFAAGLALLAVEPSPVTIVLAAVGTGLGFGGLMPAVQAIAVKAVPEARIGLATSTFFVMLDVGVGFGPVLLGVFLPLTGFAGMYAVLCALVVLTIGVYLLVHGRKPVSRRPGAATAVGDAGAGISG
ncbi:major facilitator superfamily protein [Arthrobacter crystallopoietes BAB-32]|uniref:Major facilitator superfamily protein n=1 Tax=Arthrobacter crystallopoietes BAB-32 TaxID=1246476 RepID=N1UXU1_9MICC|nr:MFS transporter [Arthrobacter crystallopoietes]EMY35211.1 major facilitator superfamily protein [Arthrobacter crystallopoietes BAB-32]